MNRIFLFITSLLYCFNSWASSPVHLGVASNFHQAAKELAQAFEKQSDYKVIISSASSGKLYAQIKHGLPLDALLSADQKIPANLAKEGFAEKDSLFTYATGRLVLWSTDPKLLNNEKIPSFMDLKAAGVNKLAIANPKLAPYGLAALQSLQKQQNFAEFETMLVRGDNINQCFQYIYSGSAQLGFIALSQYQKVKDQGSAFLIPAKLHQAIKQDAVILTRGKNRLGALAFMAFLQSEAAKTYLNKYGYE